MLSGVGVTASISSPQGEVKMPLLSKVKFNESGEVVSGFCRFCKSRDEAQKKGFCRKVNKIDFCSYLRKPRALGDSGREW